MLCDCLAVVAIACIAAPQEPSKPNAASPSLLDELTEKSGKIRAFHASFTMKSGDEPKPSTLSCDYRAPHDVRVVMATEGLTISSWYVDHVFVFRLTPNSGAGANQGPHARVDLGEFEPSRTSVEKSLEREFGEPALGWLPRATISMKWSFDTATGEGTFEIIAGD